MADEQIERQPEEPSHPWEGLESQFQLLYRVRPESRAWRKIVKHLTPLLVGFARRFLRRPHCDTSDLAGGVVQEWWAKLPELFQKYDASIPFFPFGYLVFQRLCWSRSRGNKVKRLPGLSHDPIDPRTNPVRDSARRELRERLGQALWRLPKEQRQPIVLQWKGASLVKAARRQGCTRNTLYIRASRGRKQLQAWLADLARFFRHG